MVGWAVSGRFRFLLLLLFRGEGGPLDVLRRKEGRAVPDRGREGSEKREKEAQVTLSVFFLFLLLVPPSASLKLQLVIASDVCSGPTLPLVHNAAKK